MTAQRVRLIDQHGQVIATAQVTEENGSFRGHIDPTSIHEPFRQLFEEYEEVVNSRMFSLLDDIEQKIEDLSLAVLFDDASQAKISDLQIYPKTRKVSFIPLKKETVQGVRDDSTNPGTSNSHIHALVANPSESLSVEIKRWVNPDQPEGVAILVKAALAMRNYGGGYVVIGFDNETLAPDNNNVPNNVKSLFHTDKLQGLISRFASEPFQVVVDFAEREGQLYPIIIIPPGVKSPVAAKSDLKFLDKTLISTDAVYVRSLIANNTPSTTRATWKDWQHIIDVCFDNREADIGRFLRRHLGNITPELIRQFTSLFSIAEERETTTEERLESYLRESEDRLQSVISERSLTLPPHGSWEVALLLVGKVPLHFTNTEFLNLLAANNPQYTGWPVWLDSRGFKDKYAHPFVAKGVWEAFIFSLNKDLSDQIDFMRLEPKGRFYLYRALQDDVSGSRFAPAPMTVLDFGLPIIRSAEAIAVGIAFAKAMGCVAEETQLAFAFRWKKLKGRQLGSWANPGRFIFPGQFAYQDEVRAYVNVPLDTPISALGSFVNEVIRPLFEAFDGFVLSGSVVEDLVRQLVERKL